LTFAENITDLTKGNKIFNQFIKRLTYKYPNLKYVAVIEFQKRGAIHYHLLCNLPYVDNKEIKKIWRQGFIRINKIDNVDNVGAYMSKYLGKEIDERMFRRKKFFRSQNLTQPTELIGYRAKQFIENNLLTLTPTFEKTFFSIWTEKVDYSVYTLRLREEKIFL